MSEIPLPRLTVAIAPRASLCAIRRGRRRSNPEPSSACLSSAACSGSGKAQAMAARALARPPALDSEVSAAQTNASALRLFRSDDARGAKSAEELAQLAGGLNTASQGITPGGNPRSSARVTVRGEGCPRSGSQLLACGELVTCRSMRRSSDAEQCEATGRRRTCRARRATVGARSRAVSSGGRPPQRARAQIDGWCRWVIERPESGGRSGGKLNPTEDCRTWRFSGREYIVESTPRPSGREKLTSRCMPDRQLGEGAYRRAATSGSKRIRAGEPQGRAR